jgi:hypothetical protein
MWMGTLTLTVALCLAPAVGWSAIEPFALYSTGAGTTPGNVDANYTLVSTPSGPGGTAYHTVAAGKWVPQTGWISDRPDSTILQHAVGDYVFEQNFSLQGFGSNAEIDMDIRVDNRVKVLLNGNDVSGGFVGSHSSTTNLLVNDDSLFNFMGGNTLTFIVRNFFGPNGHPMGLWVNVNSATAQVVPEPSTLAMWGGGLLIGLIAFRRRNKKTA